VSGFVDGEGCFFINIYKRKDSVLGEGVKLVIKITQDSRNSDLLASFVKIFGCGAIYNQSKSTGNVQDFMVTGLSHITDKVIPFFLAHPLQGAKKKEFADFIKVAELMKLKAHLTKEGLEEIRAIKFGMNQGRPYSVSVPVAASLITYTNAVVDKHSPETILKMTEAHLSMEGENPMLNKKHSDESRKIMSESKSGENNPMFGKIHSTETRNKMSTAKLGQAKPEGSGRPCQAIEVIDIKNNLTTQYDSISAAAIALDISSASIRSFLLRSKNRQKPYKNRYIFKKHP